MSQYGGRVLIDGLDTSSHVHDGQSGRQDEKYRDLFEQTPIGIWEEDWSEVKPLVDELKTQRIGDIYQYLTEHRKLAERLAWEADIIEFNESTVHMYHAPSKELFRPMAETDFLTDDEFLAFCRTVDAFARGETRCVVEGWESTYDNQQIYVRDTVFIPEQYRDTWERVIHTTEDNTSRRLMEHERERLIADLEKKNAELEQFSYTVSHDLKSPLVTIRGFLGLCDEDLETGNLEQLKLDLTRIDHAAMKMQNLLYDLLKLARIGRTLGESQPVDMLEVARDVLRLLEGTIRDNDITVELSGDLSKVQGDRSRLHEVLQNLIENSVKFMGGQLRPHIEVGVRRSCAEVVVYVQDNGAGIEPRYHEKAFNLFERLDTAGDGTGVGLAVARKIVECHGGRIWIKSEGNGTGCRVMFAIPRAQTT